MRDERSERGSVYSDITERKRAEEKITQQLKELRRWYQAT